MRVGFPADDTIRESMPEKGGYFEQRSVNEGKSTAFVLKVANSSLEDSSLNGFLAEYYPVKGEIITQEDLTFESYPATKYQYLTAVNEEELGDEESEFCEEEFPLESEEVPEYDFSEESPEEESASEAEYS